MSEASAIDTWAFKRGALVYPQPVAASCGRILRTSSPKERIDACLKAATDAAGISEHQAAAGSALNVAEAKEALRFLVHQVLLEERDGRFHLKPHLKEGYRP